MRSTIITLLNEYHRVEEIFQGTLPRQCLPVSVATVCIGPGGYDKGVSLLRSHHNGDMAKVAADIFAHYYISGRNSLAVKLIVSEREREEDRNYRGMRGIYSVYLSL